VCCKELREAFETEAVKTGRPVLLLTAAVAAGQETIDAAYDVPLLVKYVLWPYKRGGRSTERHQVGLLPSTQYFIHKMS